MPDRTLAERQRRHRERADLAGLARVEVFVPKDKTQEIREIAATMREQALAGMILRKPELG